MRHPVQEPADAAHMCLVPIQRLPVRGADTVDTPFEPGQCSQDVVEAFWLREINVAPGTITVNHRFSFRRRQPVFGLDHRRGVHCGVCAEFSGSFWWIWTILPEGWRRALRASLRTQRGVVHEQQAIHQVSAACSSLNSPTRNSAGVQMSSLPNPSRRRI